jgi:hypothetical protein
MAVELLGAFGLSTATTVPVQLLRAVKLERFKRLAWDGPTGWLLHDRVNIAIDQMMAADAATWGHLKATRVRQALLGLKVSAQLCNKSCPNLQVAVRTCHQQPCTVCCRVAV